MVARVAIVSVLILLVVLAALGTGIYLAKRRERIMARERGLPLKGDLTASEERALVALLASAAQIMRNLGTNDESNYGDPEILRADTRIDVGRWLQVYEAKTQIKEKVN